MKQEGWFFGKDQGGEEFSFHVSRVKLATFRAAPAPEPKEGEEEEEDESSLKFQDDKDESFYEVEGKDAARTWEEWKKFHQASEALPASETK